MRITGAQEPSGNRCVSPIVENEGLTVELGNLVQILHRGDEDLASSFKKCDLASALANIKSR
jgi:hypothetical protein